MMKARYRRMGSKGDGDPIIEIEGIIKNTTYGTSPGDAYALRDALSAALEDWEKDLDVLLRKNAP